MTPTTKLKVQSCFKERNGINTRKMKTVDIKCSKSSKTMIRSKIR